jgi:CRP/FNR family transcriptional regulator, cyclic AMP receptor protein
MTDMFDPAYDKPGGKDSGNILPPSTLTALKMLQTNLAYPEGYKFFTRGQSPSGIYILHAGRVRISVDNGGEKLLLDFALPGDILGLSAVVSGQCHEETAEAAIPCQAGFITCKDFQSFLDQHPEAAFWIVQVLSKHVTSALEHLASFQRLPSRRMTQ